MVGTMLTHAAALAWIATPRNRQRGHDAPVGERRFRNRSQRRRRSKPRLPDFEVSRVDKAIAIRIARAQSTAATEAPLPRQEISAVDPAVGVEIRIVGCRRHQRRQREG